MSRTLRTWLAFGLSAALAASAVGWVSLIALRLNQAEAQARARSELEERVRLALWRMESALAPLVAREAARPYFAYSAFYPAERAYTKMLAELDRGEVLVPSPLLATNDPLVLLHFQVEPDGRLSSPQVPGELVQKLAESGGFLDRARLSAAAGRLARLNKTLDRPMLLAALPLESQPPVLLAQVLPANPAGGQEQVKGGKGKNWKPEQVIEQEDLRNKMLNVQDYQARYQYAQKQQLDNQMANDWNLNPKTSPGQSVQRPQGRQDGQSSGRQQIANPSQGGQAANNPPAQPVQQAATQGVPQGANQPVAVAVNPGPQTLLDVTTGEMKPLWLGGNLILARRVSADGRSYVQGCWLDWPALRKRLLDDCRDLLPAAEILPVRSGPGESRERMLAAIPARLLPGPQPAAPGGPFTPVHLSLLAAWGGLLLAAGAAAALLGGTLSLSERRGAFVSAVTHELRSPLTTFRMYAEMLAEGMVPDEARRRQYLATLRAEADRLGHLVENVLAYARLENSRRSARSEPLAVAALLERVGERLARRAAQAGMELVVYTEDRGPATGNCCTVLADPAAVEQILFNLVDNASKYASGAGEKHVRLEVARDGRFAALRVRDGGPGVSPDVREKLFRPFSRSAREAAGSAPGVGLGLALSRRLARQMGGDLRLEPADGQGACFVLTLPLA